MPATNRLSVDQLGSDLVPAWSLVDELAWELQNWMLQLIGIVLLYLVGLSGSEHIISKKCAYIHIT